MESNQNRAKAAENLHEDHPNLAISGEWLTVHICHPSVGEAEAECQGPKTMLDLHSKSEAILKSLLLGI